MFIFRGVDNITVNYHKTSSPLKKNRWSRDAEASKLLPLYVGGGFLNIRYFQPDFVEKTIQFDLRIYLFHLGLVQPPSFDDFLLLGTSYQSVCG